MEYFPGRRSHFGWRLGFYALTSGRCRSMPSIEDLKECPCCLSQLDQGMAPWHLVCAKCDYEASLFTPEINQKGSTALDEARRANGLEEVRKDNFERIIEVIERYLSPGKSILEVGAGHGWFLEKARRQFKVLGVEPDDVVYENAMALGVPVLKGFFPQVLERTSKFDCIVFNDVFEHLPDPRAALEACAKHLNDDGLIVINLPTSSGVIYRVARCLALLGLRGPFERMWQKGMPSPHLHYFNEKNLRALAADLHFCFLTAFELRALRLRGLYNRISFAGGNVWTSTVLWLVGAITVPCLRFFHEDVEVVVMRRPVSVL